MFLMHYLSILFQRSYVILFIVIFSFFWLFHSTTAAWTFLHRLNLKMNQANLVVSWLWILIHDLRVSAPNSCSIGSYYRLLHFEVLLCFGLRWSHFAIVFPALLCVCPYAHDVVCAIQTQSKTNWKLNSRSRPHILYSYQECSSRAWTDPVLCPKFKLLVYAGGLVIFGIWKWGRLK